MKLSQTFTPLTTVSLHLFYSNLIFNIINTNVHPKIMFLTVDYNSKDENIAAKMLHILLTYRYNHNVQPPRENVKN